MKAVIESSRNVLAEQNKYQPVQSQANIYQTI